VLRQHHTRQHDAVHCEKAGQVNLTTRLSILNRIREKTGPARGLFYYTREEVSGDDPGRDPEAHPGLYGEEDSTQGE